MFKNISRIIAIFVIGTIGGIFADQILWPYFIERPLFYKYRLEQSPVYVTERKEIFIQENIALKQAIEKVEKVVVGIKTKTKQGKIIEGSGLIVSSDGLMVTLAELVPQGSDFSFFWQGEPVHFQILARKNNLALIKLGEENLPTTSFADLEKLKMGERVFLIGTIFENEKPSPVINQGIVKSFSKDFIQTNMFEKNILAGSPLFDIEGNVLGLNTIDLEDAIDLQGKVIAIPNDQIKSLAGF